MELYKVMNLKFSLVILMLLGNLNSQNNYYDPPMISQVEIVPYRIIPSDTPGYGCWSEIEMLGESEYSSGVREKLYHEIIMRELYNEVPEYVVIKSDGNNLKSYYVLRLPINEYYNYGILK